MFFFYFLLANELYKIILLNYIISLQTLRLLKHIKYKYSAGIAHCINEPNRQETQTYFSVPHMKNFKLCI